MFTSCFDFAGLKAGDEIVVLNGRVVSDLDMVFVENLLADSDIISLTVRSMSLPSGMVTIETPMTCPPPPSQSRLSDNSIESLKIPPPSSGMMNILDQDFFLQSSLITVWSYTLQLCVQILRSSLK